MNSNLTTQYEILIILRQLEWFLKVILNVFESVLCSTF